MCQWCKADIALKGAPHLTFLAREYAGKVYHLRCFTTLQRMARVTGGTL